MPLISVNPEAKPLGDFPVVRPGDYELAIESYEEQTSKAGNPMISWNLRFVAPFVELEDEAGQPLTGEPGHIFHRTVTSPPDKQGMLRSFVEGVIGQWRDFDPEDLVGQTFSAKVKVRTYEGNKSNEISKIYVKESV